MEKTRIQQIEKDIKAYYEAIDHAEGAIAEAERELDEELERMSAAEFDNIEDYPEYDKD